MRTEETVALSPAQQLLCWVDRVTPDIVFGPRFVSVAGYQVKGPLEVAVLRAALNDLVREHPALRTVMVCDGPMSRQRILPPAAVPFVEVTPERLHETVSGGHYPIDSLPALWAFLARRDDRDATLVLAAHHTIADPWSMELLITDLLQAIGHRLAGVTRPVHPHRTVFDRAGRNTEPPWDYWRSVFQDVPDLSLPEPAPGGTHRAAEITFAVPVTEAMLRERSRPRRTTPFVLLLAAFLDALGAVTGADDAVVSVLTYGRDRADWDTVGLFMNALPIRAKLASGTAAESVARAHAAFAAAYTRELPLTELLSAVAEAERFFAPGGPVSAQFEVMQLPRRQLSVPLSYRPVRLDTEFGGPVLPLNGIAAWLEPEPDGRYRGTIRYRCDLFTTATVHRLAQRYLARLFELMRP